MFEDKVTYAPFQLFEYDHKPGNYCLMLSDQHFAVTEDAFAAGNREGGGYGWADVALQVIRSSEPEREKQLGLDPEAGMFVAYGTDLETLKWLGALLHSAFHDADKLTKLAAAAPFEYD